MLYCIHWTISLQILKNHRNPFATMDEPLDPQVTLKAILAKLVFVELSMPSKVLKAWIMMDFIGKF